MSDFLPAGRLSKVTEDGVVVQIQTEFSKRPHPRVATTVCLDGVVLHKIQKDWDAPIESQEQQIAVEHFIGRQHHEVVTVIESQKKQIVNGHRAQGTVNALDELLKIDGVNGAWCLTDKGIVTIDSAGRELIPEYTAVFEGLISLCKFLSETSLMGEAVDGEVILDQDQLMIYKREEKYYIVAIEPECDSKSISKAVRAVMENI
jgi:hypothetical protein